MGRRKDIRRKKGKGENEKKKKKHGRGTEGCLVGETLEEKRKGS